MSLPVHIERNETHHIHLKQPINATNKLINHFVIYVFLKYRQQWLYRGRGFCVWIEGPITRSVILLAANVCNWVRVHWPLYQYWQLVEANQTTTKNRKHKSLYDFKCILNFIVHLCARYFFIYREELPGHFKKGDDNRLCIMMTKSAS